MAEEYRLSVGIDASAAGKGAAEFKEATLEITRSGNQAIVAAAQLSDGIKKITTTADGKRITEFTRALDDAGTSVKVLGGNIDTVNKNITTPVAIIKEAAKETVSYSETLKELASGLGTGADSLKTMADASSTSSGAMKKITAETDSMTVAFREFLEEQAKLGDADAAKLLKIADAYGEVREKALEAASASEQVKDISLILNPTLEIGDTDDSALMRLLGSFETLPQVDSSQPLSVTVQAEVENSPEEQLRAEFANLPTQEAVQYLSVLVQPSVDDSLLETATDQIADLEPKQADQLVEITLVSSMDTTDAERQIEDSLQKITTAVREVDLSSMVDQFDALPAALHGALASSLGVTKALNEQGVEVLKLASSYESLTQGAANLGDMGAQVTMDAASAARLLSDALADTEGATTAVATELGKTEQAVAGTVTGVEELAAKAQTAADALQAAVSPPPPPEDPLERLRKALDEVTAQAKKAEDALSGSLDVDVSTQVATLNEFDAAIRKVTVALAATGKLNTVETLTQMSDQFRELYTTALETRPQLESVSKALSDLTKGADSLNSLTDAFLDFNRTAVQLKTEFEAGAISVQEYASALFKLEQRTIASATELLEYRNAIVAAINAGHENSDSLLRLLPTLDKMIAGYGQAKVSIDEYQKSMEEIPPTMEEAVATTGGFSVELAAMAERFAEAGDAVQASKLFDLSDEFREMEQHIAAAFQPGSELLEQFAASAGMTADQVKELYTTFGQLIADITEAQLAFQQGTSTAEEYRDAVDSINDRIKAVLPELAELRTQLQMDTNAQDASKEIEDMIEKLAEGQKQMEEFSETQRQTADSGAALNNTMTTLGVTAGRINQVFFRLMGLTGLSAAFYAATSEASEFANMMVKITNMANLTEDGVDQLSESLKDLGEEFGNRNIEEAASTLAIMSRGFREAADAAEILRASNELADATFGDVRSSAAALSQAMAAFQMDAAEAGDAAATLAVAAGGSAEAMQQMAFMAGRLGATMQQAGISLEDYALAVSALRQSGMETRRAIMGLTQLVVSLTNQSTKAKLRFEELGVAVDAQRIAYEGLGPVLQEIYEKTEGNKAALQRLLGSAQAATVVLAMMRNEGENYSKAATAMSEKQKLMAEMAERVNATFTKLANDLRSRLLNRLEEFGNKIKAFVIPMLQGMNENIETTARIMKIGFEVGGILTAMSLIGKSIMGVVAMMAQMELASKRLKIEATADAAQVAAAVKTAAEESALAVESSRARILRATNKLGLYVILAIVGVDIYKAVRDWANSAVPGFKPLFDVIDFIGVAAYQSVKDALNILLYFVKMVAQALEGIFLLVVNRIEENIGKAAQKLGVLIGMIPGFEDAGASLREKGEAWVKEAINSTSEWKAELKALNQELYKSIDESSAVVEAARPWGDLDTTTAEYTDAVRLLNAALMDTSAQLFAISEAGQKAGPAISSALSSVKATADKYTLNPPQPLGFGQQAMGRPRYMGPTPPLGENVMQEIEGAISADSRLGVLKQIDEVRSRIRELNDQPDSKFKTEGLQALSAQLTNLNIQLDQLAQKRSPMEEYMRSVIAAADPAAAALYAYQDRVRQLDNALAKGMNTESYRQQLNAAAIAYAEASKAAGLYANEVKTVQQAIDPATAAMDNYVQAAWVAVKALQAGVEQADVDEYLRVQGDILTNNLQAAKQQMDSIKQLQASYDPLMAIETQREAALQRINAIVRQAGESEDEYTAAKARATAEINRQYDAQKRLAELEQNKLATLVAKYDPLVAIELARTRELIEMRNAVEELNLSEQERVQIAQELEAVINKNYAKERAQIKGSIDMAEAWKEAWRSAIERIDGAFVELWKSMFKGIDGFKEQLKDIGKQIVAELAHAAFTRPMVMNLAEMMGTKEDNPISSVLREKAMSLLGSQNKPFETKASAEKTIAGGLALWQQAGGGFGGETGTSTDPITAMAKKLAEGFGDTASAFSNAVVLSAEEFGAALEGTILSEDGWAKTLQGIAGSLSGYASPGAVLAAAGGTAAEAAAGTVVGSASDGSGIAINGMSTLLKGIGKLNTAFSMFASSFSGNFTAYLAGNWVPAAQYGAMAQSGAAGYGAIAGQVAGSAAYGLAAGTATNMLLGERGDPTRNMMFSAIGGIVGNLILPGWGALIGGAIGSLVDNIIGGAKELKRFEGHIKVTGSNIELWTKQVVKVSDSWFKSHKETTIDTLPNTVYEQVASSFHLIQNNLRIFAKELEVSTDAIDNFSEEVKFSMKGKSGDEIEAKIRQKTMNLAGKQILAFVNNTEGLSDRFKTLVQYYTQYTRDFAKQASTEGIAGALGEFFNKFMQQTSAATGDISMRGNFSEEFFKAFELLSALEAGMTTSATEGGQKLFDESIKTPSQKYADLADRAIDVAETFDGTLTSLEAVTNAYLEQKQAAFELAAALKSASVEISKMFADTAESIRMSLMTPEELYNYQRAKVDELVKALDQTTDPQELARLSQEINSLVGSMYQGLDETQRKAMAPEFLSFLDGVDDLVQEQITEGLGALDTSDADVTETISELLLGTVMSLSESTATYADSMGAFGAHVDAFGNYVGALGAMLEDFFGNYQPPPPNQGTSGTRQGLSGNQLFDRVISNFRTEVNA